MIDKIAKEIVFSLYNMQYMKSGLNMRCKISEYHKKSLGKVKKVISKYDGSHGKVPILKIFGLRGGADFALFSATGDIKYFYFKEKRLRTIYRGAGWKTRYNSFLMKAKLFEQYFPMSKVISCGKREIVTECIIPSENIDDETVLNQLLNSYEKFFSEYNPKDKISLEQIIDDAIKKLGNSRCDFTKLLDTYHLDKNITFPASIVHADLKPDNLVIKDGTAYMIDFGGYAYSQYFLDDILYYIILKPKLLINYLCGKYDCRFEKLFAAKEDIFSPDYRFMYLLMVVIVAHGDNSRLLMSRVYKTIKEDSSLIESNKEVSRAIYELCRLYPSDFSSEFNKTVNN